jgi:hypothetical protein
VLFLSHCICNATLLHLLAPFPKRSRRKNESEKQFQTKTNPCKEPIAENGISRKREKKQRAWEQSPISSQTKISRKQTSIHASRKNPDSLLICIIPKNSENSQKTSQAVSCMPYLFKKGVYPKHPFMRLSKDQKDQKKKEETPLNTKRYLANFQRENKKKTLSNKPSS